MQKIEAVLLSIRGTFIITNRTIRYALLFTKTKKGAATRMMHLWLTMDMIMRAEVGVTT